MERDEALVAIRSKVQNQNQNLIKHMLATEAVMRALARRFSEDEGEWAIAGLLYWRLCKASPRTWAFSRFPGILQKEGGRRC